MSLPTIAMRVCICLRCGWQWVSRKLDGGRPARCPHCKSPYWDRPLERETVSVAVKAARKREKEMTHDEQFALSQQAHANLKAAYPEAAYIEEQTNGHPDPNAVMVVYQKRPDRRLKEGFRMVPMGAVRMTTAAKGDTRLRKQLRGWNGQ